MGRAKEGWVVCGGTGGTGALGTAVVGALVGAGAICHVPWRDAGEAERFDYRQHKQVKLIGAIDLSDEAGAFGT
jgi:NAD(P)-dependent dehydrogenase (short-subunit alcohol dehydrogenase family)